MRRQLAVLVASTTSVVVIAFLIPLALLVRELAEDRAVAAATQDAQNLALLVGVLDDRAQLATVVQDINQRSGRVTTVFLPGGGRIGAEAERTRDVEVAAGGSATSRGVDGGHEVLQPVSIGNGQAVIRTFVPEEQLRSGVTRAWLVLLGLGIGLLAVALVVADRLARRVAQPLQALAEATHQLGEGKLDTRVDPGGPPEVVELGTVVNRLARRIRELLAAERELVADLSHRLRTPITALRLDSEGLRDPVEAERLGTDVDALERAVDDVIRDARRQPGAAAVADASDVVRERVGFWAALADDQERPLHLHVDPGGIPVGVSGTDLAAAVDALLQNALTHTPDGTPVYVHLCGRDGGGALLLVEDAGPGFKDEVQAERGTSGRGSTGLGLDIVGRTADASGGLMRLERSAHGGALVRVELGPPAPRG
jgi:signal transduction histidine kinase